MTKLGLSLNIESVTSDFELNIMKAVDDMLSVNILGCFFHLKKALKTKVDKKGFKNNYENDAKFRKFVNSTAAIAHLPEEDLEDALKNIEDDFKFEEEKLEEFKIYFLKYIQDVWVNV